MQNTFINLRESMAPFFETWFKYKKTDSFEIQIGTFDYWACPPRVLDTRVVDSTQL